jgi:hypothetical protein
LAGAGIGAGIGGGIGGLGGYYLGNAIGGKSGGAIGSALGGIAGSLLGAYLGFSLFEDGGIMTSRGPIPLRRYAGGGVANSPQMAMFGEGDSPEAFVPVPAGRIPVEIRQPANDDRRRTTNNVTINLPPASNGFGYSADQIAARSMEKLTAFRRNL